MDTIDLKQKLSFNLSGQDHTDLMTTSMYLVYRTIEANKRLTINQLKALLCVEYLLKDEAVDAALSGLISRSMFNCVKRWRDPSKAIGDMSLSVTEPPPEDFKSWLDRAEGNYPEFSIFVPPLFQRK